MDTLEYETKVLNVNPQDLFNKLIKIGASETPEVLMRRYVFDMESENSEWVRLRDNGSKVTMAYKYKVLKNTEIGKTVEIEVEVSDFDKTAEILKKLNFSRIFYQENKKHIFNFKDIEYSIDTWPMIEPFLEIESSSKEKVQEGLELLNLKGKDVGDKDIKEIFQEKGIDLHSHKDLRFIK